MRVGGKAAARWRPRGAVALVIMAALLWAAWLWNAPGVDAPDIATARVHAIDGDSLALGSGPDARTIRLLGIDAPEYRQICTGGDGMSWPCGVHARDRLATLVKGQSVSCTIAARDQYHRELAHCATAGTRDVGAVMVREGWAMSNASIASASGYPVEEAQAARDQVGIWRGTFDNPRDWRDTHRLVGAD